MAENTKCKISHKNQKSVPWTRVLSTKHLISSITCKKGRIRAKKHNKSEQITELRLKECLLVHRGPTGSVPWTDEQGPPECWAVVVAALEWWCHGGLGCDFFVSVGAAVDQSVMQSTATSGPCIIFLVISFITHHSWRRRRLFLWLGLVVNRWVICGGPLGGVEDWSLPLFWSAVDHVFRNYIAHLCFEHRAKWEGKWCLKATFPSPFQMFQDASLCGRLRFVE
uniref:Uncharacterized protein n=1 Tax=Fagus sylvatica TaxID=28930 RepID=A0A2N9J4X2_FAGSY